MKNLCESNFCNNCCKNCRYLIRYLMKKVQTFSVFDFAVFKMCLICFGGWLATTFIKNAKKWKLVLLIGFLASWVYLIWRLFIQQDDQ